MKLFMHTHNREASCIVNISHVCTFMFREKKANIVHLQWTYFVLFKLRSRRPFNWFTVFTFIVWQFIEHFFVTTNLNLMKNISTIFTLKKCHFWPFQIFPFFTARFTFSYLRHIFVFLLKQNVFNLCANHITVNYMYIMIFWHVIKLWKWL